MNKFHKLAHAGRSTAAKFGAGVAAATASAGAFAQDAKLSDVVVAELTSGKTQIIAIGGAVLVLVAVVALIRHIRSAAR